MAASKTLTTDQFGRMQQRKTSSDTESLQRRTFSASDDPRIIDSFFTKSNKEISAEELVGHLSETSNEAPLDTTLRQH